MPIHKRKDWNIREAKRPTESLILSIIPSEAPGISAKDIEQRVPVAKRTIRTILGNLQAEGAIKKLNARQYQRVTEEVS